MLWWMAPPASTHRVTVRPSPGISGRCCPPSLRLEQGQAGYARVTAEFDPESQSARLRTMWTDVMDGHR